MGIRKPIVIGERFTRLVVTAPQGRDSRGNRLWLCLCDCGKPKLVAQNHLRTGNTQSCGCLGAERLKQEREAVDHGMSNSPEWRAWKGAKARCDNPNLPGYENWGGRGIRICERFRVFDNFFADLGNKPAPNRDYSIDRKDNDGHYSCGKCEECIANGWQFNLRWATRSEQNANQRPRHEVAHYG